MRKGKTLFKILRILCSTMLISLCCTFVPAYASEMLVPKADDNLRSFLRRQSALEATEDGYMRVYYDGESVGIEYYDDAFRVISKKSIAMELEHWGGFYAGEDAYYLIEGQDNVEQNDSAEIIRVIQYDKSWNRTAAAKITGNTDLFGGEVRYPFDAGCVEATEYQGKLYIVTGHEGYVDDAVGQGHQGYLMIEVDQTTMTGEIVDCDLWHSFAQYIEQKDSDLYVLEQSEGSRNTKLTKYDIASLNAMSIPVLEYGGSRTSAWAIECYASVDGIAVSSDYVLGIGTSIDQTKYDEVNEDTPHNIYLTVTPISDFSEESTTVKWITDFTDGGTSFVGLKITKIHDNRFMLSWEANEEYGTGMSDDVLSGYTLHYCFLDGAGNVISDEFTASAPISECQPIVKNGKVVYYASNANTVNFYTIDVQTGAFEKTGYCVAGENLIWNIKDGILTISGSGAMDVDMDVNYRYPLSSTAGWVSYSSGDNCWKAVRDSVEKIVIKSKVTHISDKAFQWFDALTEVVIEPGVESIGDLVFYSCEKLRKITIPSSVQSIGEDILWTGYYSGSEENHIVYAKIYAQENSYAVEYAKENNLKVEIAHDPKNNGVEKVEYKEPTCLEDGNIECWVCKFCDRIYTDETQSEEYTADSVLLPAGHAFEIVNSDESTAYLICKRCGIEKSAVIPTFMYVYWNYTDGTGMYSTAFKKEFLVGEKIYYWIQPSPTDYEGDINITISDPSCLQYSRIDDTDGYFIPKKAGIVEVTFSSEYNPNLSKTYKFEIKDNTLEPVNPFTDVSESDYYYKAILWAVERNITQGLTSAIFGPNAACSRAQVVSFLWRNAGRPEPSTSVCPFTDVPEDAYYRKAVLWAVEKNITSGFTNTLFAPDEVCTRAQIVTFLWRYADKPNSNNTVCIFEDVDQSAYYYKAVLWAVENKITSGFTNTQFAPDEVCTRAQVVTFLYRNTNK